MVEIMDKIPTRLQKSRPERSWRGPTITEIARQSGVGTATVDRVLNGRDSVREVTRKKVLAALESLGSAAAERPEQRRRRIAFLSDSGASFNRTLENAVQDYCHTHAAADCSFSGVTTSKVDAVKFANLIERTAEESDGLVIVAREDLMINRAIRGVMARRVPVVCLTTDLPTSSRVAYIGTDQTGAGATAAYLMGQVVGSRPGKILLIYSAPYRCQEERELGFRRVLRSEFSHLDVDERVNSNDDMDFIYRNVVRYIEDHGPPAGIYNVAAGNLGIGRALREFELQGKVVFIGHEINANSRTLLETGVMNFAIGHDVSVEVAQAIECVAAHLDKHPVAAPAATKVRIYTKYSCN
jgi:LacI family transcriptional regulator